MVAPTWLLMSSPMIGSPRSAKRRCQYGSRPMKTGIALMKPTPALQRLLDVPLGRLLGADRQVRDHHVDLPLLEDAHHVGRRAGRFLDDLRQVLAEAVVGHAAIDGHAGVRHVGELERVVLTREDCL